MFPLRVDLPTKNQRCSNDNAATASASRLSKASQSKVCILPWPKMDGWWWWWWFSGYFQEYHPMSVIFRIQDSSFLKKCHRNRGVGLLPFCQMSFLISGRKSMFFLGDSAWLLVGGFWPWVVSNDLQWLATPQLFRASPTNWLCASKYSEIHRSKEPISSKIKNFSWNESFEIPRIQKESTSILSQHVLKLKICVYTYPPATCAWNWDQLEETSHTKNTFFCSVPFGVCFLTFTSSMTFTFEKVQIES